MRAAMALVAVVAASGCAGDVSRPEAATAVDGDTLEVRAGTGSETVRLIGIDTPETSKPVNPVEFGLEDTNSSRRCLSRVAQAASQKMEEVEGTEIRTVSNGERGSYGRLLAYVFSGNSSRSINYQMVRRGYARVYESRFSKRPLFLEAQEKARKQELGVWAC